MSTATKDWLITAQEDDNITILEKAVDGRVTLKDITDALSEYKRLFVANIASPAEVLTLYRAYPTKKVYTEAVKKLGLENVDNQPMVLGGPASIEVVDREGHLITTNALKKAFGRYMDNFRTRNAMVLHSDVQVGWALPAYISQSGQIFKSGVDDKGLYFITELRADTKIAKRVEKQIDEGKLKSYSIAGSATKTQNITKGMEHYMQVDDLELAEVTVCEKGVNQESSFQLIKSEHEAVKTCIDGSCLIHLEKAEPNCGCTQIELMEDERGEIDLTQTFFNYMKKEEEDPFKSGKTFATLQNVLARELTHHQLLDDLGFPGELEAEDARYTPVTEYDPANPKPPWIVNESGQDLGNRHVDDALTKPGSKKQFQDMPSSKISPLARLEKLVKAVDNPYAVATSQAKKMGYKNFKEGSPGDKKKDKIAEAIKEGKMLDTERENDVLREDPKETPLKKLLAFSKAQKLKDPSGWAVGWAIAQQGTEDAEGKTHPMVNPLYGKGPASKEAQKALAAKIAAGASDNPFN